MSKKKGELWWCVRSEGILEPKSARRNKADCFYYWTGDFRKIFFPKTDKVVRIRVTEEPTCEMREIQKGIREIKRGEWVEWKPKWRTEGKHA